jgi:Txe/YoeB family toxin of Txe-Axe toxin-antitoxin module
MTFKLSINWIWNHIKVFKVESYWTQKLYDWKQGSIPFSVSSRKIKIVIHNIKVIFLIICIGLQKTIVVVCKIIALIPIFIVICCIWCWKWFKAMFSASSIVMGQNPKQQENFNDLKPYVLQLQDDMELSERTLKSISKSVNRLIKKAEKQQPCNLVKLIRESKGFEGVGKYESLHVPPLVAEDYLDCWSLPLVTLTAIAVSLPKIQNDRIDRLLSSVSEGLTYVTLVVESLNATDEYVSIQKAAKVLWLEVEVSNKWVGNNLKNHAPEVNTAGLILQWFKNTAKNMVTEVQVIDIRSTNDNSIYQSICANSMYRITESILLSYHTNIDELSQEDLFTELSSMIADILAACLTNLPQVIVTKCHESVIEKRESSVNATIQLLGETTQIINNLQDRELPDLDPAEFVGIIIT